MFDIHIDTVLSPRPTFSPSSFIVKLFIRIYFSTIFPKTTRDLVYITSFQLELYRQIQLYSTKTKENFKKLKFVIDFNIFEVYYKGEMEVIIWTGYQSKRRLLKLV